MHYKTTATSPHVEGTLHAQSMWKTDDKKQEQPLQNIVKFSVLLTTTSVRYIKHWKKKRSGWGREEGAKEGTVFRCLKDLNARVLLTQLEHLLHHNLNYIKHRCVAKFIIYGWDITTIVVVGKDREIKNEHQKIRITLHISLNISHTHTYISHNLNNCYTIWVCMSSCVHHNACHILYRIFPKKPGNSAMRWEIFYLRLS